MVHDIFNDQAQGKGVTLAALALQWPGSLARVPPCSFAVLGFRANPRWCSIVDVEIVPPFPLPGVSIPYIPYTYHNTTHTIIVSYYQTTILVASH